MSHSRTLRNKLNGGRDPGPIALMRKRFPKSRAERMQGKGETLYTKYLRLFLMNRAAERGNTTLAV